MYSSRRTGDPSWGGIKVLSSRLTTGGGPLTVRIIVISSELVVLVHIEADLN